MILSSINTALYPNMTGSRQIFVGTGNGPASYNATTGDVLSVGVLNFQIDSVVGPCVSVSGNYIVFPQVTVSGKVSTWTLKWFAFSPTTGLSTASAADLSKEVVQLSVIGLG